MAFVSFLIGLVKIFLCWISFNKFDFCEHQAPPPTGTLAPITISPITVSPITASPITASPVSAAPVSQAPVSQAPAPGSVAKTCTAPPTDPMDFTPGERVCGECNDSNSIKTFNTFTNSDGFGGQTTSTTTNTFCGCITKNAETATGTCNGATDDCFKNAISSDGKVDTGNGGACTSARRRSLSQNVLQVDSKSTIMEVIGFIRVPKTGSTTAVNYLADGKGIHTWEEMYDSGKESMSGDSTSLPTTSISTSCTSTGGKTAALGRCIFGHVMPNTKGQGQLGATEETGVNGHRGGDARYFNKFCPHIPYPRMVKMWEKSLENWTPPPSKDFRSAGKGLPKMESEAFTMVRDPFDRLVSFFYYVRGYTETNEFLKHTVTEEQYVKVKENDLAGWLELMYVQDGGCGLEMPNQFPYLHKDVNQAIAMIQADAEPQVTALVTECYEASLHLLASTVHGLDPAAVDPFIQSDAYKSNTNKKYDERPSKEALLELRKKAEYWFASDFAFYHAAVEQFVVRLKRSNLDENVLRSCKYWTAEESVKMIA